MVRLGLAAAWLALPGCLGVVGSGVYAEEQRIVDPFSTVDANNGTTVVLDVDPMADGEVVLTVSADDNLLPELETIVSGDTLFVDVAVNANSRNELRVEGTVAELDRVAANNGCSVDVDGLGGSDLVVDVDNGSLVTLRGEGAELRLDVNNGANFAGSGLTVEEATVAVSNGATATVCVTGTVSGEVTGGASLIALCGGDTSAVQVSGGGSVTGS